MATMLVIGADVAFDFGVSAKRSPESWRSSYPIPKLSDVARRRHQGLMSLPPSSGSKLVRTTTGVAFRSVVGTNGEVEMEFAL